MELLHIAEKEGVYGMVPPGLEFGDGWGHCCVLSVQEMAKVLSDHEKLSDSYYVDDKKYSALVKEMLSEQAWTKHRLLLFIFGTDHNTESIDAFKKSIDRRSVSSWLRMWHRRYVSFLKQQLHAAKKGSEQQKAAAVKILQSRGLIVDIASLTEKQKIWVGPYYQERNLMLFNAVADGWATEDIQVFLVA